MAPLAAVMRSILPSGRRTCAATAAVLASAGLLAAVGCNADRSGQPKANALQTAADPQSAAPKAATLRVGTWNIEWLGTPDSRGGPAKGSAQSIEDLADYIAFAEVDVLGVCEVARNERGSEWRSDILEAALDRVEAVRGGEWTHVLYPANSGRNQLCGVAWNTKRVSAVGRSWPLPVSQKQSAAGKPLWSRPPFAQKLSLGTGQTDFAMIMVHMKSDSGGEFDAHRGEEAAALVAALEPARSTLSEADFLIMGDVNCGAAGEPGVQSFTAAGFIDLNAGDSATHVRWGPLDRGFVPAGQPEFTRRFEVVKDAYLRARGMDERQFRERLSDHYMIVTEIAAGADDD